MGDKTRSPTELLQQEVSKRRKHADWSALISSIAEVTLRSAVVSPGGPTPPLSPFEKIRIL